MTPRSPSTGSLSTIAATASRMTLNVPIRLTRITCSNCSSGSTPCLPSTRPGVPMPAQLMTMRSGPRPAAVDTACCTAPSSVTSAGANLPPSSCARCSPADDGRSMMTTLAPAFASSVAVARPRPLAPPVTIALLPSIRIRFLLHHDEHRARLDLLSRRHLHLGHLTASRGGNGVLHLHGFEDDERLARLDGRARLHQDAHDRTGHRCD